MIDTNLRENKVVETASNKINFDKYRGIIISIALFVILDASVLLMNFFISFQVAEDAEAVNIAGRQRMLSQRIMKSLLETQLNVNSLNSQKTVNVSLNELKKSGLLFDQTLKAFAQGGNTLDTSGNEITLTALSQQQSLNTIQKASELWLPLYNAITVASLDNDQTSTHTHIDHAVDLGKKSNLTLLALMNNLTNDLAQVAFDKAALLRWIQTAGILLAILNFFIIMRHFIRQLRDSDQKIAAAQKETKQILNNVDEGLFLMDENLVMSDQHSANMVSIFQKPDIAGSSFTSYIKDLVSTKTVETAQEYLELLFDKSKKQRLLGDLNPLKEVPIQISDSKNNYINKYLRFSFSRVQEGDEIKRVLATVSDITNEITLAQELEISHKRNSQQMEMLSTVLNAGSNVVPLFLNNSNKIYTEINDVLKRSSKGSTDYKDKANELLALIHGVKGDASAISLTVISDLCFELENELKKINNKADLNGRDFLKSTVLLEQLISYNHALEDLFSSVFSNVKSTNKQTGETQRDWKHFDDLAMQVAERQNKSVEFMSAGLNDHVMNDQCAETINSIAVQLIRNSLTHGIETPAERRALSKPTKGTVKLILTKRDNGFFELAVIDDGAGLNKEKIIQKALSKKIIESTEATKLTKNQAVSLMFHPNLSTSNHVDQDSGQGIGLHLVHKIVKEAGGEISVRTIKNGGIRFIVLLPHVPAENAIESTAQIDKQL